MVKKRNKMLSKSTASKDAVILKQNSKTLKNPQDGTKAMLSQSKDNAVAEKVCETKKKSEQQHSAEDDQNIESSIKQKELDGKDRISIDALNYFSANLSSDVHGVLFLNQNQKVALHGYTMVSVLCGQVEINGFTIQGSLAAPLKEYEVYSPTSDSLQYIRDKTCRQLEVSEIKSNDVKAVCHFIEERVCEKLDEMFVKKSVFAVLLLKRLISSLPFVLKKLNDFKQFVDKPILYAEPFELAVLETEQWHEVTSKCENSEDAKDCQCSTLLCGGKDVGKSSFARFMINRLLTKHACVFYLECDCGQTEFTAPAVLSLVKVTSPLLGPPFTHLKKPIESYFYGHISPGSSPTVYINIIQQLFKTYQLNYDHQGPLIINQQGWVKGLGVSLLIDTILITSPCNIIQINSTVESRNLVVDLSDSFLNRQEGWSIEAKYPSLKINVHPCSYHKITNSSELTTKISGSHKGTASRNLNITSYFSELYQSNFKSFGKNVQNLYADWIPPSLSAMTPFVVAWKDVGIHVLHVKVDFNVMLHAFNMALVALAVIDQNQFLPMDNALDGLPQRLINNPKANYVGLGIVRNIDPNNKLFYILTPETLNTLKNVNALLKGNIQLPQSYLQEINCIEYLQDDNVMFNKVYHFHIVQSICIRQISTAIKKYWLERFQARGIDNPTLCVYEIHQYVKSFSQKEHAVKFEELCERRYSGEPLQYIIEEWDFRDLTLRMKQPVFIPRPETAQLIDLINKDIQKREKSDARVLEVGCGSGAISLSLLKENSNVECVALDKIAEACGLTRENAIRHSLTDRLHVILKDIVHVQLEDFQHGRFDMLVSNPPYISHSDITNLQVEVKDYEDHNALDGGKEGLDVIHSILKIAQVLLHPGSSIWLEVDETHPNKIEKLIKERQEFQLDYIKTYKDFYEKPRFCHLMLKNT